MRNSRLNHSDEIVQQESILVWCDAGPSLHPVFRPCQRTGPRQDFDQDAPHQAAKVHRSARRWCVTTTPNTTHKMNSRCNSRIAAANAEYTFPFLTPPSFAVPSS